MLVKTQPAITVEEERPIRIKLEKHSNRHEKQCNLIKKGTRLTVRALSMTMCAMSVTVLTPTCLSLLWAGHFIIDDLLSRTYRNTFL